VAQKNPAHCAPHKAAKRQHGTDIHGHAAEMSPIVHDQVGAPSFKTIGTHEDLRAGEASHHVGAVPIEAELLQPIGKIIRQSVDSEIVASWGPAVGVVVDTESKGFSGHLQL